MIKEMDIYKISNYDKFKCIADKCSFTCCSGWDISIDNETYNKWQAETDMSLNLLTNVKSKKINNKKEYYINKEIHEYCEFLDDKGLCQIVKSYGEGYLSSTCRMFPRIENTLGDRKEFTLSCSCPEVVELIASLNSEINMFSKDDSPREDSPLELKIRSTIIDILRDKHLSMENKLLVGFQMLVSILENNDCEEYSIIGELNKYKNKEYLHQLANLYEEHGGNRIEAIEETNNLFLDIIQNYKEVPLLQGLLSDISDFGEAVELEKLLDKWKDYKCLFGKYDFLLENCLVGKVLSSCTSDDIEELAISFEMIIIQYILIRYAVFLKYCMNESKETSIGDIKNYIVVFSRIIENNTEAVEDFFRDGFGEVILEIGYLCFIAKF